MKISTSAVRLSLPILAGVAAAFLAGCDKDKDDAASKTSSSATSSASTVAAPAVKARDTEQMTPAPVSPSAPVSGAVAPSTPMRSADVPATSAQPMFGASGWDEIKDYTYADKAALVTRVKAMTEQLNTAAFSLRSSSAKPEFADSRSTALAALEEARSIVAQRRESLENASAETWQSAKSEFRSTWKTATDAYDKAKMMSN